MTVKIIKNYIILLVVFFSWVNIANANVIINEVAWMGNSSNTNAEWIELKGEKGTDLSNWTISGSISLTIPEGKKINGDGFFLLGRQPVDKKNIYTYIPNFIPDYTYNGVLVNTGGELILSGTNDDSLSFFSGWPAGNSTTKETMQWNGVKWVTAIPTPGEENVSSSDNNSNEEDSVGNTDNTNTDSSELENTNQPVILKITTKIISPKIVVAGIPFTISSQTTTNRGETYAVGKYIWNFGDGGFREVGVASPFEYTYDYPGEYVLNLSYFASTFSKEAEATNRVTIKVISSDVFISGVGSWADPYIELENKSKYEVILSKWIINAGAHYFVIPDGTTLLPGKKIKLSPKITGFTGDDIKYISISTPSREVVATYPIQIKRTVQKTSVASGISKNTVVPSEIDLSENSNIINLNDLGASVSDSGVNISKSAYPIIGLILVIGIGIASFLMIKNRNKEKVVDYIEREIRAEDMKIIE
jgi:hypothetical protein